MKFDFVRHSQPDCEHPKKQWTFPQSEVPRERWLKRFIESYRRNCVQMEKLSDYTKNLEAAYRHLQSENKKLKLENELLDDRIRLLNDACVTESDLYYGYKTAIRGQYYYIHYLKTMLRLNNVNYKKKLSFNTVQSNIVDALINEAVNDTTFTK